MPARAIGRGLEFLNCKIGVGKDANLAGDAHRFHSEIFRAELGMLDQGTRGSQGEAAAGADGAQTVVRFDDISISGKQKSGFGIRDDEQRFEVAQRAILTPLLGKFDGGFLQIAGMFLELAFETLEERDGVRGRTGKTGNDFVVEEAAGLARGVLHHLIAHGHLAVGDENNFIVLAHAQYGGAVNRCASLAVTHPAIIQRGVVQGTSEHLGALVAIAALGRENNQGFGGGGGVGGGGDGVVAAGEFSFWDLARRAWR
jgi:hypothetical protein